MTRTKLAAGQWSADSEAAYGFTIRKRGLTGLSDGVGVRRPDTPRPGQHGSFDEPVLLESRIISVSGKCFARSEDELYDLGAELRGLGATGERFPLSIEHAGHSLWGWARRGAQPIFEDHPALLYADWQFDFWLPNPRLFGETRESVSTPGVYASAINRGNFPATPRFVVDAPFANGYRIEGPDGRLYTVVPPMTGSSKDVIDFSTGFVARNGTTMLDAVTSSRLWTVPGGAEVRWRITAIDGGTGSARMYLPDTYI